MGGFVFDLGCLIQYNFILWFIYFNLKYKVNMGNQNLVLLGKRTSESNNTTQDSINNTTPILVKDKTQKHASFLNNSNNNSNDMVLENASNSDLYQILNLLKQKTLSITDTNFILQSIDNEIAFKIYDSLLQENNMNAACKLEIICSDLDIIL